MLQMGLLVGLLSMVTSYLWWTTDWWQPVTFTGTRVGIEDFLMGFFAGGIMSSGYEIVFRWFDVKDNRKSENFIKQSNLILICLALITAFLFWFLDFRSAASCFIAMILTIFYTVCIRPDLKNIVIGSAITMFLCCLPFYIILAIFFPNWIVATYPFDVWTGYRIYNIPIEEFIFWFLAGAVFGPFYEVRRGFREVTK